MTEIISVIPPFYIKDENGIYQILITAYPEKIKLLEQKIRNDFFLTREYYSAQLKEHITYHMKEEILRKTGANQIRDFQIYYFNPAKTMHTKIALVKANLIYYPMIFSIMKSIKLQKDGRLFLESLYDWSISKDDLNFFSLYQKELLLEQLKKCLIIQKNMILNKDEIITILSLEKQGICTNFKAQFSNWEAGFLPFISLFNHSQQEEKILQK